MIFPWFFLGFPLGTRGMSHKCRGAERIREMGTQFPKVSSLEQKMSGLGWFERFYIDIYIYIYR